MCGFLLSSRLCAMQVIGGKDSKSGDINSPAPAVKRTVKPPPGVKVLTPGNSPEVCRPLITTSCFKKQAT